MYAFSSKQLTIIIEALKVFSSKTSDFVITKFMHVVVMDIVLKTKENDSLFLFFKTNEPLI